MNDTIGKLPKIKSQEHALKEILYIAKDKRGHLLLEDHCDWLELKLKAIRILTKRGLKTKNERRP